MGVARSLAKSSTNSTPFSLFPENTGSFLDLFGGTNFLEVLVGQDNGSNLITRLGGTTLVPLKLS